MFSKTAKVFFVLGIAFLGCDVGEQRAGYNVLTPFYTTAEELVRRCYLSRGRLEGRFQYYSLTPLGKLHNKPRERQLARL